METVLSKTPRAHSLSDQIIRYMPFHTKILELPLPRIDPGPKDQNEVSGFLSREGVVPELVYSPGTSIKE